MTGSQEALDRFERQAAWPMMFLALAMFGRGRDPNSSAGDVPLADIIVSYAVAPRRAGMPTGTGSTRMAALAAATSASRAGLVPPPLRVHDLRHTAASLMIASGGDVKVVQQQLGHRTATMTLDLYTHLFPDELDALSSALDVLKARTRRIPCGLRAASQTLAAGAHNV
jgi:integrase